MDTFEQRGKTIEMLQECLREKNLELDAMHWVWCDGGCESGAHRFTDSPLTAEHVAIAIRNTRRLMSWYVNKAGREYYAGPGGFSAARGHTREELEEAWNQAGRRINEELWKLLNETHDEEEPTP